MKYVIGLDLGTTCIKALLFDENCQILAQASRDDALITPERGYVEQDAAQFLALSVEVIREAVESAAIDKRDVAAISVSSQGITVVPVDASFKPLMNAINWLDMRTGEEEVELAAYGDDKIYTLTGKRVASGGYTLAKLLWIKKHCRDIYERAAYLLLPHDYVAAHMCGRAVTDHTMASATMLYDLVNQRWSDEILTSFGIDKALLPELLWSGDIAGNLTQSSAELLGLTTDVLVVTGGQDQKVAAYAAGLSATTSTISMGTCCAYEFLFDAPPAHPRRDMPAFSYVESKKWTLEGCTNTTGAAIKWARDNIFTGLEFDDMNDLAAKAPIGSHGVMFFPYLSGSGTPHYAQANGVLGGLTLEASRCDIARALYEGIAYEARQNLESAQEAGVKTEEFVVFGGGSKSAPLCQIIADVTGRELISFACPEMGAMGAAKLCAKALKLTNFGKTIRDGSKVWKPDVERHNKYSELYAQYLEKMQGVIQL